VRRSAQKHAITANASGGETDNPQPRFLTSKRERKRKKTNWEERFGFLVFLSNSKRVTKKLKSQRGRRRVWG